MLAGAAATAGVCDSGGETQAPVARASSTEARRQDGGNPFFSQPLMLHRTMIFGDHSLEAFKARLQTSRPMAAP